jgi:hypothetical protein
MNEKRMKTAHNTGEVSLPPAHEAGWGVKAGAEHGCGSGKPGFGVEKWLARPRDERIIAKTDGKTRFEP